MNATSTLPTSHARERRGFGKIEAMNKICLSIICRPTFSVDETLDAYIKHACVGVEKFSQRFECVLCFELIRPFSVHIHHIRHPA